MLLGVGPKSASVATSASNAGSSGASADGAGEGAAGEREGEALGDLGARIIASLRERPALGRLFDDFEEPDVEIARVVERLLANDLARPLPRVSPDPR